MVETRPRQYPIKTRVILHGLVGSPQYNGRKGVVESPLTAEGRQRVYLLPAAVVALGDTGITSDINVSDGSNNKKSKNDGEEEANNMLGLKPINLRYEPRTIESLTVKELKTILSRLSCISQNNENSASSFSNASDNHEATMHKSPNSKPKPIVTTGMDKSNLRALVSTLAGNDSEVLACLLATPYYAAGEPIPSSHNHYNNHPFTSNINNPSLFPNNNDISSDSFTPSDLREKAKAIRSIHPDTLRANNPSIANWSDDDIRTAAYRMEHVANNPHFKQHLQNDFCQKKQNRYANGNDNLNHPSSSSFGINQDPFIGLANMTPADLKKTISIVRSDPRLLREMISSGRREGAFDIITEEQMMQALSVAELVDDRIIQFFLFCVRFWQKHFTDANKYGKANRILLGASVFVIICLYVYGLWKLLSWLHMYAIRLWIEGQQENASNDVTVLSESLNNIPSHQIPSQHFMEKVYSEFDEF